MYLNHVYYNVHAFVQFGPNGEAGMSQRARAPTLELAFKAVNELKLTRYAITCELVLSSTVPLPSEAGDAKEDLLSGTAHLPIIGKGKLNG